VFIGEEGLSATSWIVGENGRAPEGYR
jgi:hypothetical protein